jgi:hypothetical protein
MALLVKALELLLSAAMSPTVLPLLRAAVRSIMSDELVNAPGRGQEDELFEQKVKNSGMADVPLPAHYPEP